LDAIYFNGWSPIAALEPAKSNSFSDLKEMAVHPHSSSKLYSSSDALYHSAKTMHVGMFGFWLVLYTVHFDNLRQFKICKSMHPHIPKTCPIIVTGTTSFCGHTLYSQDGVNHSLHCGCP